MSLTDIKETTNAGYEAYMRFLTGVGVSITMIKRKFANAVASVMSALSANGVKEKK